MKQIIKKYKIYILLFLTIPLPYTILNIFNICPPNIYYLIGSIIIFVILGYNLSKIFKNQILIKTSIINIAVFIILNLISLILKYFTTKILIFNLIILASLTLGTIFRINKKG